MRLISPLGLKQSIAINTTLETGKCLEEIIDNEPSVDPVHAAGGCYCRECARKDSTACPAYDAPFMRTSLRIKFCSEGQRKENDHDKHPSDPV